MMRCCRSLSYPYPYPSTLTLALTLTLTPTLTLARFAMGLFDTPNKNTKANNVTSAEHNALARC